MWTSTGKSSVGTANGISEPALLNQRPGETTDAREFSPASVTSGIPMNLVVDVRRNGGWKYFWRGQATYNRRVIDVQGRSIFGFHRHAA